MEPWYGHLQTILPAIAGFHPRVKYHRFRIKTPDYDFFDLDMLPSEFKSDRILLVSHGLEGSSNGRYIRSLIHAFRNIPVHIAVRNLRGCSGEINKQKYFYHSGDTRDLHQAIQYLNRERGYREIFLLGYSLGGNQTLKALSETDVLSDKVVAGAAVSVPLDLQGSALLFSAGNKIYMKNFLNSLLPKIEKKRQLYPDILPASKDIRNFIDFDRRYTAPLNNFIDEVDYWENSSALYRLRFINRPVILINARNDPFLSKTCFPESEILNNPNIKVFYPEKGGHVGFPSAARIRTSDRMIRVFFQSFLS